MVLHRQNLRLIAANDLLLAREGKRGGVDAVAQAGGRGAVGEDMAKVAAATRAGDFNTAHSEGVVFVLVDGCDSAGMRNWASRNASRTWCLS